MNKIKSKLNTILPILLFTYAGFILLTGIINIAMSTIGAASFIMITVMALLAVFAGLTFLMDKLHNYKLLGIVPLVVIIFYNGIAYVNNFSNINFNNGWTGMYAFLSSFAGLVFIVAAVLIFLSYLAPNIQSTCTKVSVILIIVAFGLLVTALFCSSIYYFTNDMGKLGVSELFSLIENLILCCILSLSVMVLKD